MGEGAVFTGDVRNGVVSAKKVRGVRVEVLTEVRRMRTLDKVKEKRPELPLVNGRICDAKGCHTPVAELCSD